MSGNEVTVKSPATQASSMTGLKLGTFTVTVNVYQDSDRNQKASVTLTIIVAACQVSSITYSSGALSANYNVLVYAGQGK